MAIDSKRQPGHFLLTGSVNVLLLPKLSESFGWPNGVVDPLAVLAGGGIKGVREGTQQRDIHEGMKLDALESSNRMKTKSYKEDLWKQLKDREFVSAYLAEALESGMKTKKLSLHKMESDGVSA